MKTQSRFIAVVAVLVTVGGAWWLGRTSAPTSAKPPASTDDVMYWYDPMRPEVHFDKPGRSPFMDMELVPKKRDAGASETVAISARTAQNLGIRIAAVSETEIAPEVTVTGVVTADERRLAVITTRADGWIERLDVRTTGEAVRRGQRIAGFYSPDLLAAQEEFLLAVRSGDAVLVPAARRRLELLGVTESQRERITRSGKAERLVDLVSPANGVVTELAVREGASVTSGAALMTLADLADLWVIAEVPESQGAWLDRNSRAELHLATGDTIEGRVDYLYPEVSTATRTIRVRIVVPGAQSALRPGMSVRAVIRGEPRLALAAPTESIIRSGTRAAVIVADGTGGFRPVAVETGVELGDLTEIRSGLRAGDRVVVSGQFLIDSEANLRGALEKLQSEPAQ
jgi:Cu(I)/Ag(I) efflux system membrane fusion protein